MQEKTGYVFRKDGKYFYYATSTNHCGTHEFTAWVDDINNATVFNMLPSPRARGWLDDAEKLEAVERKTVTLL